MSATAAGTRRSYDVHGVGIDVCSQDAAVLAAMDLRLRDFRCAPREAQISFEFVAGEQEDAAGSDLAAQRARPVYDTPYGSLRYFPGQDVLSGELGGVQLHCEPRRGVALFRSPAFDGRALYFATHPLATISLMELLERRGRYSLHAACLASSEGRGVLLSGTSGAGKSTLSLALVRAGMSFLSDDVVFLAGDGAPPGLRVLGFADTVGLTPYAAARFPELQSRLNEPLADGFPKRLSRIEDLFGVSALGSCEPRALVFPEVVAAQRSEIERLDPREALLRLVPDVLLTEPAATQAHLAAIAALLDQVSCYELRSGVDLERAAELVRELV